MASSLAVKVASLMLMWMLVASPMAVQGLACNDMVTQLTPCLSYIMGGSTVASACCTGIKNVKNAAKTPADRKAVCKCLLNIASQYPVSGVNINQAASLPGKCGVNIPYKISPNTNCDNIE